MCEVAARGMALIGFESQRSVCDFSDEVSAVLLIFLFLHVVAFACLQRCPISY